MNELKAFYAFPTSQVLEIIHGDITEENVDAIVNAANAHLQHGGGVAAAIVSKAGREIQAESNLWVERHGLVSHSEPALTSSGKLPCKFIIHAVGPIWGEGDEDEKLTAAIHGSLSLADHLSLTSMALPAISTGIFGFPKDRAAFLIYSEIQHYFLKNPASNLNLVRITIIDHPTLDVFLNQFHLFFNQEQS